MDTLGIVREALRKRCKGSRLQGNGLDEKIAKATGLSVVDVRNAFAKLKFNGEMGCHSWTRNNSPLGMIDLDLTKPPLPKHQQEWISLIDSIGFSGSDSTALKELGPSMEGIALPDMKRLTEGLVALRTEQSNHYGEPTFNVSAKYLMGSSKMISSLNSNALRKFGIHLEQFVGASKYLIAAGPKNPEAVILVENPHSFELVVNAGLSKSVAWVVTFGYGLSKQGNEYGDQLTQIVESGFDHVELLSRSGSPPSISELFNHPKILFWGDLDIEGLKIYARLKSKLPDLSLSSLYQPMVNLLQSRQGHPYVAAVGKDNQKRWSSDNELITSLLRLCSDISIDQEALSIDDIVAHDLTSSL